MDIFFKCVKDSFQNLNFHIKKAFFITTQQLLLYVIDFDR